MREQATERGIAVEHGKRLAGAQDTGDGVRALFADGTEAAGNVLIGCDGVHSAVRRIIDPAAWCSPSALRDMPGPQAACDAFEAARRPRVERIIKWAARIDNSKAAGPVARVLRDAMLPAILKATADGKAPKQVYDHHIDWHSPTLAAA